MSGLILFVDNDLIDVARLATHLKLAGFSSDVVHSAVAAKDRILADRPLLAVIDALVPYTERPGEAPQDTSYAPGLGLAQWLRVHLPGQSFVLRSAIRDLPWTAVAAGAGIELFSKPSDRQQLLEIAQSVPSAARVVQEPLRPSAAAPRRVTLISAGRNRIAGQAGSSPARHAG